MALLFRNSLFISKILSSSETLYNIESQHIDMLEKCDRSIFTRILNVPSTCSSEALYLETGCLPIRYILKGRRLMYYWTLLHKSEKELVKRFFDWQKQFPSKSD